MSYGIDSGYLENAGRIALNFLCSAFCKQYADEPNFHIDEAHPPGLRHLVVVYSDPKRRDFLAGIPNNWTDEKVLELILWTMKDENAPYPSWETSTSVRAADVVRVLGKGR